MANPKDPSFLSELLQKPPNLSHLRKLTTPLGIIQHARGAAPDLKHGYSIDDSARALIVCLWYAELFGPDKVQGLAEIYLNHILDAQLPNGKFHNFKDKDGKFLDAEGTEDSFGRSVWALGVAAKSGLVDRQAAEKALTKALPHLVSLEPPRSLAFALLGVVAAGEKEQAKALGEKLLGWFQKNSQPTWEWFEDCLYYSNGILPYSLWVAGEKSFQETALTSLQFLNRVSRVDGIPAPIGNRGWYCQGKERALYDQQPVDAADMVLVNLAAYERTGNEAFKKEAQDWLRWFYGFNVKQTTMITSEGGCYDGLWEKPINTNQGAESTVVYLLAQLSMAKQSGREKGSPL